MDDVMTAVGVFLTAVGWVLAGLLLVAAVVVLVDLVAHMGRYRRKRR